jgi:hypothetical protein
VGAVSSTAHASRCRIIGTCASQQSTLQNTNPLRLRVQVDTLHTKYVAENAIGSLHVLQRFQTSASLVIRGAW